MTQVITSQQQIYQIRKKVKFTLECNERLVFKLFPDNYDTKYQCLNSFGTCWPQELPVEHMVVLQSNKNTWEK